MVHQLDRWPWSTTGCLGWGIPHIGERIRKKALEPALFRIRVDWLQNCGGFNAGNPEVLCGHAVEVAAGSSLVVDVGTDNSNTADLRLLERIVANHFQKIMTRSEDVAGDQAQHGSFNPLHTEAPKTGFESVYSKIAAPVVLPRYLHVGVAAKGDDVLVLPSLLFSTASFIDENGIPHILISAHIDFRSAIFSAFNSTLDLINLMEARYNGPQRNRGQQVFRGLNSQPVEIEFEGKLYTGYMRQDSAEYLL